jgi:RNA polymerase primary sigma factor
VNQAAIKEVSPAIMQTLIDEADDRNIPVDTSQVELLRQKSSQAEAAKVRLLEGVQQYVVKVAKAFQGRGVPLEDLIQEGNLGVLKAIEKFQPEKGYAFLTYADDWIRQRMSRACTDKGSLEKYHMRMPCHMYMAIGRVQKHYPLLHDELGREPYPDELASRAEISSSQAEMALKVLSRSTVSLDAHWANDDSDVSVGEAIADDQATDPLREITEEERRSQVWKAFEQLPTEEQQVLFMRLGLGDDGRKYTQEQVCAALDIKKSKLVTIQRRASNKLKVAPELQELADEILSRLDD